MNGAGGTGRPGGWVDGIGWVAELFDVPTGTWVKVCADPNSVRYRTSSKTRTAVSRNPYVLVVRWADGEVPAPPAPQAEQEGRAEPEFREALRALHHAIDTWPGVALTPEVAKAYNAAEDALYGARPAAAPSPDEPGQVWRCAAPDDVDRCTPDAPHEWRGVDRCQYLPDFAAPSPDVERAERAAISDRDAMWCGALVGALTIDGIGDVLTLFQQIRSGEVQLPDGWRDHLPSAPAVPDEEADDA